MKALKYFIIFVLLCAAQIIAQQTAADTSKASDSTQAITQVDLRLLKENNKLNSADNIVSLRQYRILKKITEKIDAATSMLRQGFDSSAARQELEYLNKWNEMASSGIFEDDVNFIMTSNLSVSTIILRELLTRAELIINKLSAKRIDYEKVILGIDSLLTSDVLYQVTSDTSKSLTNLERILKMQEDASRVTNRTHKILKKIQELESLGTFIKIDLESKLLKTEYIRSARMQGEESKDFENFAQFKGDTKSLPEIFDYSFTKIFLAFAFYTANHIALIVLMILCIAGLIFYLRALRKHLSFVIAENPLSEYYVLKHPVLTSVVISANVFQFFFSNPPFIFYAGFWVITFGFLVYLLRFSVDKIWHRWFWMLYVLYLIAYLDNMILLPHIADKVGGLFLSILTIGLVLWGLLNLKKSRTKVIFLKWFLILSLFLESLALLLNLFDSFNVSKRLMIAGIMALVLIMLLMWTARIIFKVFRLSLEVYKKSDNNTFSINLDRFNKKMPRYVTAFIAIGWVYMFINFFYVLHVILQPVVDFFTAERRIGNFTFTFDSIILFVFIIFIATAASKILSYLLSDSYVIKSRQKDKKGLDLGSWVLLLRIAIISIGIMIAFVSAGIPFDRITIIISALSVGIGFGMQTLINNLVSGLIIAFEKPITVGDVVELSGQTGRMKSIGFRSSMITTWDGSDVVIPNGDLLNQHLINWTLGNSHARFNIIVGVAYGTNLETVHQLVIDLLDKHEKVLTFPQPLVVFKEFASSSIDMDIKFWVADYSTGIIVKSEIIMAIDKLFKENGIVIPFPQQDVYIKSIAKENEVK